MIDGSELDESETLRFVPLLEAVRITGVSRGTIMRWSRAKEVRSEQRDNGRWQVWLADVIARSGSVKTSEETDAAEAEAEETQIANATTEGLRNDDRMALIAAIRASNKHVQVLMEPARKYLEGIGSENDKLRARTSELEQKLQGMIETYERALGEEHKRRMEEDRMRREQDRLDMVLRKFSDYGPIVLSGLAGHFGMTQIQESMLVKMVINLSDEQMSALSQLGFGVTELGVLERIRATAKEKEKGNGKRTEPSR